MAARTAGAGESTNGARIIRRPDRGLSIDGTRKTLYQVMDYVKQNRPANEIRDELLLTEAQVAAAVEYISAHRAEVEAEYEQVVREAEEERRHWEDRNKDVLARLQGPLPHIPGKEALREKILALRA